MLRDPVERAFSAYKHEFARGFETESFERALELEDERVEPEPERMLADPDYQSFSHRHHAYLRRGHYAEQLQRLRELLPGRADPRDRERVVLRAPRDDLRRGAGLPGSAPGDADRFDRWNGRPSSPMPESTRARLREHFSSHDQALAELLGREPAWAS